MLWHEQKTTDFDSLDKSLPVVVPLGSCEQHGPHLPVFVDTLQIAAITDRVEQELTDNILVLPPLWLGSSHHHLDFSGTISVPASLFSEMIESITLSILKTGFDRILFLNGHGGNEVPGAQALSELAGKNDQADAAWIAFASWWKLGSEAMATAAVSRMATPAASHACEYETSFMLATRPDLVAMENLPADTTQRDDIWKGFDYAGRVSTFGRLHRYTKIGSLGRPDYATAEKGERLRDDVVADVVAFLKDFATWPERPVLRGP